MSQNARNPRPRDVARLVTVCEAAGDHDLVSTLADRVLLEKPSWLEAELIDTVRVWCGLTRESAFVTWTGIKREADRLHIRAHGHFAGTPGAPDAHAARRALLVITATEARPAAVVLMRDSDGDIRRRDGLEQARDSGQWPFRLVVALAHCNRECWLLCAFEPSNASEEQRLESVTRQVGFNPCLRFERLTARRASARRNAKRVLRVLFEGDLSVVERGIRETGVELLRTRGANNGLAAFLREVEERIVPLFR